MLNNSASLPTTLLGSRRIQGADNGEDVAASIREELAVGVSEALKRLKAAGIKQRTIAVELGWEDAMLSQLKSGKYSPSIAQLQRFLDVVNKYLPDGQKLSPSGLFVDPDELLMRAAKARGYQLVKKNDD